MIMASRFMNDPEWVQQLQHELYWGVVTLPFERARNIYMNAEKTLGLETQLGQDCQNKNGVDHRVLQYFHDTLATKFRYENRNDFETHLPGFLGGITEEDYIKQQWLIYFKKQIEDVFDEYRNLPRLILIAATYPNPDERGKDAEDNMWVICNSLISSIQ